MTRPLRHIKIARLVAVCAAFFSATLSAEVIVNAPQTITHRVEVQPIRVRNSSGVMATTFGTATVEAYIKAQINRVWAQVGVRIDWLPIVDYTNDFAYDGSPGNYTVNPRPSSHLDTIVDSAGAPPKSANPKVLNLFFVEIVPAFDRLDDDSTNGLAFVDGNGVTMHVGADLVTATFGWDIIASVIAHEIGHNLGLEHVSATNNLMSSNGNEERLTAAQKSIIFTNNAGIDGIDGYDLLRPLATNYSQWVAANGVTQGPEGDDDRDGIENVIEFMFNLNPKASSTLPQPALSAGRLVWTLPKRQPALDDGLVYQVQSGTNLLSWLAAGASGSGSTVLQNDATALVVRLDSGATRRFMRLNIAIPPDLTGG